MPEMLPAACPDEGEPYELSVNRLEGHPTRDGGLLPQYAGHAQPNYSADDAPLGEALDSAKGDAQERLANRRKLGVP
jgi:hypothetical protein